MQRRSPALMFLLALAMAGFGVFLVVRHVKEVEARAAGRSAGGEMEMVTVIFTKKEVPAQRALLPELVEPRQVARSPNFPPADSVTELETLKDSGGEALYTKYALAEGEIVRRVKVTTKQEATAMAFRVPEGMRAITITVSEPKAVGYAINAGDRVDAIVLYETEGGGGGSQTVLQNVQVLDFPIADPGNPERRSSAPVVTLAVTPKQAEVLALIENTARGVVLTLRRFDDFEPFETDGTTLAQALGSEAEAPVVKREAPAPQPERTIEIFQGGQRQQTSVPR